MHVHPGVWDVMTNEEVLDFVRKRIIRKMKPAQVQSYNPLLLVDVMKCYMCWSHDLQPMRCTRKCAHSAHLSV